MSTRPGSGRLTWSEHTMTITVKIPTSEGDKIPHYRVQAEVVQAIRQAMGVGVEVQGVDMDKIQAKLNRALEERNLAMVELTRLKDAG